MIGTHAISGLVLGRPNVTDPNGYTSHPIVVALMDRSPWLIHLLYLQVIALRETRQMASVPNHAFVGNVGVGRLIEGKLPLIHAKLGAPDAVEPTGAILFIADVNEASYRLLNCCAADGRSTLPWPVVDPERRRGKPATPLNNFKSKCL